MAVTPHPPVDDLLRRCCAGLCSAPRMRPEAQFTRRLSMISEAAAEIVQCGESIGRHRGYRLIP